VDEKVVVSNAVSVGIALVETAETASVVIAVIALVAIAVIVLAVIEEEGEAGLRRREVHPANLLLLSEEKVVEEDVVDLVAIVSVSETDPVTEVVIEVETEVVIDPALAGVAEIIEDPREHPLVSDEAALALLLVNKHFLSLFFSPFENSQGGSVFVTLSL